MLPTRGLYAQPAAVSNDEIQVLIDVSGSMKHNDPANLRIEASKLLINLLPNNANVSLWLFAEKTALLIHGDAISDDWKNKALAATQKIHSNGLYTHIEDAIQTVLGQGFNSTGKKSLLLLTDGMVDISKDIMQSADSRERILSEWIPKLQQRHIQVQTIALSEEADKELLQKLAFDTNGWTETAESAEQLQRLFLKMMQKTAPKDALPLKGNRFSVDSGVKEFSVLAFKKAHAAPTQLQTPDHKTIGKQQKADTLAWLDSEHYDLITVKQPQPGEWQLLADVDPDNQVMIVTDLQLKVDELPSFIDEKQAITVNAWLTDQGKPINRSDFLSMVSLTVDIDGHGSPMKPASDGRGMFTQQLDPLAAGKHALRILADGKTFKREVLKEVEVIPAIVSVEKQVDIEKRQVTLTLHPNPKLVDSKSLIGSVQIHTDGKLVDTQILIHHEDSWTAVIRSLPPGTETVVNFSLMANDNLGKPITPEVKPLTFSDKDFVAKTDHEPVEHGHQEVKHDEHQAEPVVHDDAHQPQPDAGEPAEEISWGLIIAIVLACNIVIGGLVFLVYWLIKKANLKKQQQLLERLA